MSTRIENCNPEHVSLANAMADTAREILRRAYRSQVAVERKADDSPVTAIDREAERAMRAMIEEAFPEHGIVGEEFPAVREDSGYVWELDPIDGTKAFLCALPVFGTLIALTHHGVPILGVVELPVTRDRWLGGRGLPATLNGAPARTRSCPDLAEATMCTTTPEMFTGDDVARFERVRDAVRMVRYGSDCFGYGCLASGHVDLVVESDLDPHDYLAPMAVIEAAGGVVTDWEGRPLTRTSGEEHILAAGDPRMHAAALALLRG